MIQKKKIAKDNTVQVTFQLPADMAEQSVAVVGEFNHWEAKHHPMKLDKKSGRWHATLTLEAGSVVQFRYLIDGSRWHNDDEADRLVTNPFGTKNGVLVV